MSDKKIIEAFNSIKHLLILVDDEYSYGLCLKGTYTYVPISKETYELLKEVLQCSEEQLC